MTTPAETPRGLHILGIDLSSQAIDVVALPLDTNRATWSHWPLGDGDILDRVRRIRDRLPDRTAYGDVLAIAVERPLGPHGAWQVSMALGGVLQTLPADALVHWLAPQEWKVKCGLPGNAKKPAVTAFTRATWTDIPFVNQDACDGFGIAYGLRTMLAQQELTAA